MNASTNPFRYGMAITLLSALGIALVCVACSRGDQGAKPRIASFTASPASVAPGGTVALAWSVADATGLRIDPGVGTVTGSSVQVNPTVDTTYTLTATSSAGSDTAQAAVTISTAPGLPTITSFTATPATITSGQNATLAWVVSQADSLRIDQGIGTVTGSSRSVSPTGTTTYTLTATNTSGSQTAQATVTVNAPTGAIVVDHTCTNLSAVPVEAIQTARSSLRIAYGHTSHGSQLITGMDALMASNSLYAWSESGSGDALKLDDYAMGGDVGYHPDWVNNTRSYLGAVHPSTGRGTSHPDVNVVLWSWCGQAASRTQQTMIDTYLAPMSQLETDYPGITFVYMTGHLDGSGATGNLNLRNQQIRDYCRAHNKVLFDFADIESYDPSGATHFMPLNGDDGCNYSGGNWATQWLAAHPTDPLAILATSCGECAHSQRLNCIQKGRAAWWLWARLGGWNGR